MSSEKDVVTAVIKLQEERDELAAMLAYSLGSTKNLKSFKYLERRKTNKERRRLSFS